MMQSYLIVFAEVIVTLRFLEKILASLFISSTCFFNSGLFCVVCLVKIPLFPLFSKPFLLAWHITLLLMISLIFPFNYAFIIRFFFFFFFFTLAIIYLIVQFIYLFLPFISLWTLFHIYLVFPLYLFIY